MGIKILRYVPKPGRLPCKLLDHLKENPTQPLSLYDARIRFKCTPPTLHAAILRLEAEGLLEYQRPRGGMLRLPQQET